MIDFKVGKYYKLRNGSKAYCVGICIASPDGFAQCNYPIIVATKNQPFIELNKDGRIYSSSKEDSLDIISEWEESSELDKLKEKYATGNYICIYKNNEYMKQWEVNIKPMWNGVGEYRLIHKKHKDILNAWLKDNNVKIKWFNEKTQKWWSFTGNFIEDYKEYIDSNTKKILKYKLKKKPKK